MLKVLKFGGTSVGSAENMMRIAQIISSEGAKIVVLSAMSGTTDMLVEISKSIKADDAKNIDKCIEVLTGKYKRCASSLFKTENMLSLAEAKIDSVFKTINNEIENYQDVRSDKKIISQGELLTSAIFTSYLKECEVDAVLLNAPDYIRVNEDCMPCISDIKSRMSSIGLNKHTVFVTQGFICSSNVGEIDNLGRGGSDYSAALFGSAINADEIQIWTDIDGMHNNDPRYVEGTYPIRTMLFEEAAELAYFGAKILHPATIQPCKDRGISVRLKNSMDPTAPGTLITGSSLKSRDFVAVAAKDNITIIRITSTNMLMAYGFLRKVFEIFERYKTPIDMIATSEVAVSLTIDNKCNLNQIVDELKDYGHIEVEENNTIVCVVGKVGYGEAGIAARILASITTIPVKMISYGASSRSVSFLIETGAKKTTLNNLNQHLFN